MLWGLFFIIALFFPTRALAEGEFITNYDVDYRVRSNGLTRARMNVELVNKLSNIYASEFTLSIGSTNLTDIRLETVSGPVEPKIVLGSKTTNITVVFPEKILGKDKSQKFTLEFTTSDFSRRLGNVREISIPKLAKSESLSSYRLTLAVPAAFGPAATLTPAPAGQTAADGQTIYRFDSEDLYQTGISATFGREQWYDFSFDYYLTNQNFYPVNTEIALPPDTAWQQVLYETIEPRPANLRADADGNWLAAYRLPAGSELKVTATGSATLFLEPRADYPWGINDRVNYRQPQKYWEADQPRIKDLAATLTAPRQIYDYVVNNLIYDYGRLDSAPARLGAANALDNQNSALCMEFTDLFIALSRAGGIPARAVNGYAYTDNSSLRPLSLKQDVLHAWPEYYDESRQLWRPVDPTWGNTTGGVDYFEQTDLNHFAFVILGADSSYPIPAGAYKTDSQPAKNVRVTFGRSLVPNPAVELAIDLPKESLAGVGLNGKILVKNSGNAALYQIPINLDSERNHLNFQIAALPPMASTEINFSLPITSWNSRFTETLTVSTDLTTASRQLTVSPAYRLIFGNQPFRLALFSFAALLVLKLIHARLVKAKPVA
ncbi:hypothetical protein AUJ59_02895 [Candidatus Beckwithbacteria bacterium CG1_02_47_37]|uniref:Transglutaminase-like domain-containing protein n=1 Tax=Candidatus Beckwithbacteria bacterium CG1_02_47_37 TaxID=1805034 RepID=A0A1J4RSR4_9BACT|nr:MAG: hypothetical protein AUJ59_02895 [Candidatus Beckwithbacteria bacterium CG1_02_47_37]